MENKNIRHKLISKFLSKSGILFGLKSNKLSFDDKVAISSKHLLISKITVSYSLSCSRNPQVRII